MKRANNVAFLETPTSLAQRCSPVGAKIKVSFNLLWRHTYDQGRALAYVVYLKIIHLGYRIDTARYLPHTTPELFMLQGLKLRISIPTYRDSIGECLPFIGQISLHSEPLHALNICAHATP
jgi:hypothetical protein